MEFIDSNNLWGVQPEDYDFGVSSKTAPFVTQPENQTSMYSLETTPAKALTDFPHNPNNNESLKRGLEEYEAEPSSRAKRRRGLQFGTEIINVPDFSQEKPVSDNLDDLGEALSNFSQYLCDDPVGGSAPMTDQSFDIWLESLNDEDLNLFHENADMPELPELSGLAGPSEPSNDQSNNSTVVEVVEKPPQCVPKIKKPRQVRTKGKVTFTGKKTLKQTPEVNIVSASSYVVYPFEVLKPSKFLGDVTIQDINQRIHRSQIKPSNAEDIYPTSAFSGKRVVSKQIISTKGGRGSVTIMKTKG